MKKTAATLVTAAKNKTSPNKKVGSLVVGHVLVEYIFSEYENAVWRSVRTDNDTALTPTPKMLAVRSSELF
ncbi:MAG: hypothetical protein H7336_04030 [Bacteriovorax sp.]|nr:hypothetical protein [Bacteriovorax sp.]